MADFNIQPLGAQIRPIQPMSLADMVNLARGTQAYQQATQLNPIELQTAQQQLSRLQQLTPLEVRKAEAETGVSEKTAKSRIAKAEAEAGTAQAGESTAQLRLAQDRLRGITDRLSSVYNNPLLLQAEKDPTSVKPGQLMSLMTQYGKEQAAALGIPEDKAAELIYPYMKQAMENPGGLRRFLGEKLLTTVDAAGRMAALQPSGVSVEYGGGGQVTQTGQFGPLKPGEALPGTKVIKGVAPQVYTTETGAPGVFPGAPGAIVNAPQTAAPQGGAPQAAAPAGPALLAPAAAKREPKLERGADETFKSYQERVERLNKLPGIANTLLTTSNPDSIPQAEYTNEKILRLLEKKVDVGPIAKAISEKTGGVGLNAEQQEIQKYLEQRIRQQATRTDKDQESIRTSFGGFGTNRDALMQIIYKDKGTLASQRLEMTGIRRVQGNPNKPNLAAINEFQNKFVDLSRDPEVTELYGVIGNKKTDELTPSDKQHLASFLKDKSNARIEELFKKRDALVNLVEGK